MAETKTATLTLGDKTLSLPILKPTVGPDVIDIRKLYAEADVFTYDPGFTSTAACDSAITYIDGDAGELLYRGYPIEQLADQSSHLEVCFLLLYGELPTAAQLADFNLRVTRHTMVHEQMHNFFRGFRRDRIVPHSSIRRPDSKEYFGGHEAPEGYASPEQIEKQL